MAKVFGIHYLELLPGVKEEDFEQFTTEHRYPATTRQDFTFYVLKGERGERVGKYLMICEFDSIEARDRYWPSPGVASEEGEALEASFEDVWKFVSVVGSFTDYVVVGEL